YLVIKKTCFLQCFRKAIFYDCIKLFVNLLDMLNKYSYTFFYRNITVFNTSSYGYGIHGKELLFIYGTIHDRTPPQLIDRKSTRLNSSHVSISYAVFCLKKKTILNVTIFTTP